MCFLGTNITRIVSIVFTGKFTLHGKILIIITYILKRHVYFDPETCSLSDVVFYLFQEGNIGSHRMSIITSEMFLESVKYYTFEMGSSQNGPVTPKMLKEVF